jgi:hypothetical protein
MKKTSVLVALIVWLSSAGALAATRELEKAVVRPQSAQDQPDDAKAALYKKFRDNYKNPATQKIAYDAGKEYLTKYSADADSIVKYIQKFVDAYEKADSKVQRAKQFDQDLTDKKFNEAFALGKQILADDPNDLTTTYKLGWNGLFALTSGNTTNNADAIVYANKAVAMIEAGKGFQEGTPLSPKDKDDVLGRLNYALGFYTIKSAPADAVKYLLKAAELESFAKKDPQTYSFLAVAYQASQYDKLRQDFEARCKTDGTTPECKVLTQNIEQVMDRIIDAYARAVAYATDASMAPRKADWLQQLTLFYKFRHNDSDAGLKDYLASITTKPLPPPPTLLETPPASTTPSGSQPSSGGTTTGSATPVPNHPPKGH